MRKFLSTVLLAALTLGLAACGGGDDSFKTPDDPGTLPPVVGSVDVYAQSPILQSDSNQPVQISARVVDASGRAMADVAVDFTTSSGVLTSISSTTNESGLATANLENSSDLTNRDITVTASVGTTSDTVTIRVVGTNLALSGAVSIAEGADTTSTVTLLDSSGNGIQGQTVQLSSANGNTLSSASVVTDATGKAVVTVTGSVAGTDTLTASALGLTATQQITVTAADFQFNLPSLNQEIVLNAKQQIRVVWQGQPARDILFSTTRGVLYEWDGAACTSVVLNAEVQTDSSGTASACVASTNAGPASLSATNEDSTVAVLPVEFVATTVSSVNLQPDPSSIQTSGQSTITAVVRDANNNLVKNKIVVFTLDDVTGGTLSTGAATTDSQGRAQTVYTASTTTSASNGVRVSATVQGTAVTSTTTLTVARRELFITFGTGNELEDDVTLYRIPYSLFVTDANGVAVANASVNLKVVTNWYKTGHRDFTTAWGLVVVDHCLDEDLLLGAGNGFRNGILDPGEDFNGTTRLEAGNIASVPSPIVTNSEGIAEFNVTYPQEYAYWAKVELTATATVAGTESSRSVSFILPGSADDFEDATSNPPGFVSPFGEENYGCPDPTAPYL